MEYVNLSLSLFLDQKFILWRRRRRDSANCYSSASDYFYLWVTNIAGMLYFLPSISVLEER